MAKRLKQLEPKLKRLEETEELLKASTEVNNELLEEIARLNKEVADARTKDALIDALRRRVKNLGEEYNERYFGQRTTRQATTLADVRKLTGE